MRVFWCAADIVSMWDATRKGIAAIRAVLAAKAAPKSPFAAISRKTARQIRYSN